MSFRVALACACVLGLSACATKVSMLPLPVPAFQTVDESRVAVTQTKSALPPEWKRGPFMEIFVRAYADSEGDGIGDFRGLTSKLDYIQSLGIRGLWLMPVNPSEDGDHGYAVTDYRAIAREHGTLADFDEFLKQAHARGIGVIMDYVINHSASTNPLFTRAAATKENPHRDWYVWRDVAPTDWKLFGNSPWHTLPTGAYLGGFHHTMPDFNLLNPKVLDYHLNSMRFWLNRGVDGFRFDAVSHLVENGPDAMIDQPENFAILKRVRETLAVYENRYLVCEGTGSSERYGAPQVLGSAFAFGLNGDVVKAAKGDAEALDKVANYFVKNPNFNMGTFIGNHDEFAGKRLADQFGDDAAAYRLAVAMLMTLPGVPFIYYGEEVGMNAGAGLHGDPSLRSPMSWSADERGFTSGKPFRALASNIATHNVVAQTNNNASLLAFYKALLTLRAATPALASGNYENARVENGVLRFERSVAGQRLAVVINATTRDVLLQLDRAPARNLWPVGGSASGVSLNVAARSVRVVEISP
jgi:alpha-amylase